MAIPVEEVRALILPIVTGAGMDLEDVTVTKVGRREKVAVIVDADGGVGLDAIAELSTAISAQLDERDDVAASPYVLEVSSPGVDRPLIEARHWRRAKDRLVSVELTDGRSLLGRVKDSDESQVVLDVDGESTSIALDEVARAIVQVEFDRKDA